MKFCIQCLLIRLVLLIQLIHLVNSASNQGKKCENCSNLQELSLALAILGIVSLLFITLCLCRCLPKFTQIMFSSAEQLRAQHQAQHSQRLSQILKRQQQQLRAQQLARQSQSNLSGAQNDLIEKGFYQDPFLGAGLLGSVFLNPSRLTLPSDDSNKQQVNGGLVKNKSSSDLNEIKTTPTSQSSLTLNKRIHPASFIGVATAASAATHMLHQQRNSTLRKQIAKRNLELQQKKNKLKDSSFSSSFEQTSSDKQSENRSPLSRFLKKSNAVRPVQLQHSLSLTSFAGVPKPTINQFHSPLANYSKAAIATATKPTKPNLAFNKSQQLSKYSDRVDKGIMTIQQQSITFDHDQLYDDDVNNDNRTIKANNQSTYYGDHYINRKPIDLATVYNNKSSLQNIHQQPITWLDQVSTEELNDDELVLPAPLPIDLLKRPPPPVATIKRRPSSSLIDLSVVQKSRSMPMLINQNELALFAPYYNPNEEMNDDHHLDNNHYDRQTSSFNHPPSQYHFPATRPMHACNQQDDDDEETTFAHNHSSIIGQHNNTQDDHYHQDQRRFTNSFGSNNRIDLEQQWPDVQLQQFLNAFNHYTQLKRANRNQTRSLFDLY